MATLLEMKREITDKRGLMAEKLKAVKTAPEEQKIGIIEEINRIEADLAPMHEKIVQEESLLEIERRNTLELERGNRPDPSSPHGGEGNGRGRATKSIGEILIEDEGRKTRLERFRDDKSVKTLSEEFPFQSVREWKATLSATALTGYERVPGIVTLGTQTPHVADLLAQGETTQPTVRYVRENSYSNAAAAVAENGQKPEANWDLAETDAPVRKIAVIGRVTDEMFQDFPQVRDYVNQRMPFMVEQAEDSALLNGNGTAPNLRGILQTSGILSGGVMNQAAAPELITDCLLRAMVQIEAVSFFEPDGYVMNPLDWQTVRLMKSGDGVNSAEFYIWGSPSGGGPLTIWGLPVVKTTAIAAKTALCGAFRLGAQIFRRQGITIDMTNADGNDFQYNRVAIRAETRLALAVYRPGAFAKSTLL